jgi:hypothetical protein
MRYYGARSRQEDVLQTLLLEHCGPVFPGD